MAPNCPENGIIFHAVALAGGVLATINPTYTQTVGWTGDIGQSTPTTSQARAGQEGHLHRRGTEVGVGQDPASRPARPSRAGPLADP
jgi:hypothetical protein